RQPRAENGRGPAARAVLGRGRPPAATDRARPRHGDPDSPSSPSRDRTPARAGTQAPDDPLGQPRPPPRDGGMMTAEPAATHPSADPAWLPARDHRRAPWTGLTRDHWEAVADRLLLSLRPHTSDDCARILPPGRASSSGPDSDGLEGFARSFLLAALLLHGNGGADPHGHAERYAAGLAAGTDPSSPTAWPRPGSLPQAKVE